MITPTPEAQEAGKRPYQRGAVSMSATLPAVRCTEEMLARVIARAEQDQTYVTDLIRNAVDRWLDAPHA